MGVYKKPAEFRDWLQALSSTFGSDFMLTLFVAQHIIKGLVAGGSV